jgi:hypothetical protein
MRTTRTQLIRFATLIPLTVMLTMNYASANVGPTHPTVRSEVVMTKAGPLLPPDPWDPGSVAAGPLLPPDPWDPGSVC